MFCAIQNATVKSAILTAIEPLVDWQLLRTLWTHHGVMVSGALLCQWWLAKTSSLTVFLAHRFNLLSSLHHIVSMRSFLAALLAHWCCLWTVLEMFMHLLWHCKWSVWAHSSLGIFECGKISWVGALKKSEWRQSPSVTLIKNVHWSSVFIQRAFCFLPKNTVHWCSSIHDLSSSHTCTDEKIWCGALSANWWKCLSLKALSANCWNSCHTILCAKCLDSHSSWKHFSTICWNWNSISCLNRVVRHIVHGCCGA